MVADDGSYMFAYLPAGAYTLAFSCDATDDDPDFDDNILIPSPEDQLVEVSTSAGEQWTCDFGVSGVECDLVLPMP